MTPMTADIPTPEKGSGLASFGKDTSGTVTIGFLFMSMLLYALLAGIWNTGQLADEKIQAQRTADAAAFATATHMSRTLNQIAMTNMLIVRCLSAEAVARTCVTFYTAGYLWIGFNIAKVCLQMAADVAAIAASFGTDVQAEADLVYQTSELALWLNDLIVLIEFTVKCGGDAIITKYSNMAGDLCDQQDQILKDEASALKDHLDKICRQEGLELQVHHKDAEMYSPAVSDMPQADSYMLRKCGYEEMVLLLGLRMFVLDDQWPTVAEVDDDPKASRVFPGLRGWKFFKKFKKWTWGKWVWLGSMAGEWQLLSAMSSRGYVLKCHRDVWLEWSVPEDRATTAVIAVVRKKPATSFMAPGFFTPVGDGRVLAIAQAEAHNPYSDFFDVFLANRGFLKYLGYLRNLLPPWRMWSSMGANWQPRLGRVTDDVLDPSVQRAELKKIWPGDANAQAILH